jgi:hypothetical protein
VDLHRAALGLTVLRPALVAQLANLLLISVILADIPQS